MSLQQYHFDDLIAVQDIISAAADSSLNIYYARSTADFKEDGSIVTEADLAMQHSLTELLQERFPHVRMLGEEFSHDEQQAIIDSGDDYWCLDPVDGTTNFHATVPLFSVSLALVSNGEVVLAVIYDPNLREFFGAIRGQGFWINGNRVNRPSQPESLSRCIAFVDFKRLSVQLGTHLIEQSPYKSQRNVGTCALEWAWVAAGRVHLLIHGREKLWDYAAGVLLCEEAGGMSETFDGEPVFQHSLQTRSVIAASNPQLFIQWSQRIREGL